MKKKKNRFTLIEVLIAIALATSACFFLLEFEESYIKKTQEKTDDINQGRIDRNKMHMAVQISINSREYKEIKLKLTNSLKELGYIK